MQIGDHVEYVDEYGVPHQALVTANHQPHEDKPSLNLVFVSRDSNESDQYGRQIKRETSVVHETNQGAHGRYWK